MRKPLSPCAATPAPVDSYPNLSLVCGPFHITYLSLYLTLSISLTYPYPDPISTRSPEPAPARFNRMANRQASNDQGEWKARTGGRAHLDGFACLCARLAYAPMPLDPTGEPVTYPKRRMEKAGCIG
jgi:hypothetical protein